MVFSRLSQTFGRAGAPACTALSNDAAEAGGPKHPTSDIRNSLTWCTARMANARPRKLPAGKQSRPVFIFSDGSCEPDAVGSLRIDSRIRSSRVPPRWFKPAVSGDTSRNIFGTPPRAAAPERKWSGKQRRYNASQQHVWKKKLKGRRVVCYIDNGAAKDTLITGPGPHQRQRLVRTRVSGKMSKTRNFLVVPESAVSLHLRRPAIDPVELKSWRQLAS